MAFILNLKERLVGVSPSILKGCVKGAFLLAKYFVVGDLHGELDALLHLLDKWNPEEEQLLFLGDLCSRGANSLAIIQMVMLLVKEGKAICLRGNHETMLDEFLYEHTIYKSYMSDYVGGMETLKSFVYDLLNRGYKESELSELDNLIRVINEVYKEEINFLMNLPYCHIDEDYLFVHAGIDNESTKINQIPLKAVIWGNELFYKEEHSLDKTVVFGHMPTQNLKRNGAVFISPCKKKIGIDGGIFFNSDTASAHGCVINTSKRTKKMIDYRYFIHSKKVVKTVFDIK